MQRPFILRAVQTHLPHTQLYTTILHSKRYALSSQRRCGIQTENVVKLEGRDFEKAFLTLSADEVADVCVAEGQRRGEAGRLLRQRLAMLVRMYLFRFKEDVSTRHRFSFAALTQVLRALYATPLPPLLLRDLLSHYVGPLDRITVPPGISKIDFFFVLQLTLSTGLDKSRSVTKLLQPMRAEVFKWPLFVDEQLVLLRVFKEYGFFGASEQARLLSSWHAALRSAVNFGDVAHMACYLMTHNEHKLAVDLLLQFCNNLEQHTPIASYLQSHKKKLIPSLVTVALRIHTLCLHYEAQPVNTRKAEVGTLRSDINHIISFAVLLIIVAARKDAHKNRSFTILMKKDAPYEMGSVFFRTHLATLQTECRTDLLLLCLRISFRRGFSQSLNLLPKYNALRTLHRHSKANSVELHRRLKPMNDNVVLSLLQVHLGATVWNRSAFNSVNIEILRHLKRFIHRDLPFKFRVGEETTRVGEGVVSAYVTVLSRAVVCTKGGGVAGCIAGFARCVLDANIAKNWDFIESFVRIMINKALGTSIESFPREISPKNAPFPTQNLTKKWILLMKQLHSKGNIFTSSGTPILPSSVHSFPPFDHTVEQPQPTEVSEKVAAWLCSHPHLSLSRERLRMEVCDKLLSGIPKVRHHLERSRSLQNHYAQPLPQHPPPRHRYTLRATEASLKALLSIPPEELPPDAALSGFIMAVVHAASIGADVDDVVRRFARWDAWRMDGETVLETLLPGFVSKMVGGSAVDVEGGRVLSGLARERGASRGWGAVQIALFLLPNETVLVDALSAKAAEAKFTPLQLQSDAPLLLLLFARTARLPSHAIGLTETLYTPLKILSRADPTLHNQVQPALDAWERFALI